MKTATKNEFMDSEIRALIKKHFPADTVHEIIPIEGGTFHTIYCVNGSGELEKGIILKTGPKDGVQITDHEKNSVQTEVCAYKMLEGKKIPVPKIFAYDFSKTIIPCDYILMERMEGETWYRHWPISDPGLMRALGKYTARIHSASMDWFGFITGESAGRFDKWGEAFEFMITQALMEIKKQGLKLPFEKIRNAVASRRMMLDKLKKPSLVNFDLWAGNIFVEKRGDEFYLTGMIDFERSFLGDPLASFAGAFLLYDDVEKEPAFLAGYNEASEEPLVITNTEREKMALYEMLMYLRGYSETKRYRGLFRMVQRIGIRLSIRYLLWWLKRLENMREKDSG